MKFQDALEHMKDGGICSYRYVNSYEYYKIMDDHFYMSSFIGEKWHEAIISYKIMIDEFNWTRIEKENKKSKEEIFFEQVKGKKIRWSTWENKAFFIPECFYLEKEIRGKNEGGFTVLYSIRNGFDLCNGYNWEFYVEKTKEEIFFEKVRDKKIRRTNWIKDSWFKPRYLNDNNKMFGEYYCESKGITPNHIEEVIDDHYWEFYKEPRWIWEYLLKVNKSNMIANYRYMSEIPMTESEFKEQIIDKRKDTDVVVAYYNKLEWTKE